MLKKTFKNNWNICLVWYLVTSSSGKKRNVLYILLANTRNNVTRNWKSIKAPTKKEWENKLKQVYEMENLTVNHCAINHCYCSVTSFISCHWPECLYTPNPTLLHQEHHNDEFSLPMTEMKELEQNIRKKKNYLTNTFWQIVSRNGYKVSKTNKYIIIAGTFTDVKWNRSYFRHQCTHLRCLYECGSIFKKHNLYFTCPCVLCHKALCLHSKCVITRNRRGKLSFKNGPVLSSCLWYCYEKHFVFPPSCLKTQT